MRIGFVGAGAIAHRHLEVLASRDVDVVAVCDTDEQRASAAAAGPGARTYTDRGQMFDAESLDAVFVCTPPAAHVEPASEALGRGVAVYLEKPLARAVGDGRTIVAAWAASPAVCAVGYQWRSLDVVDAIRRAIGDAPPGMLVSRSFGPTEGGRNDLAQATGSWFLDPGRSGGILFELGSHDIDLQLAVAGPVESVWATAAQGRLALAGAPASELDDAVVVFLQFESGCLGAVHVGWTDAQDPPVYTLDVQAPQAALRLDLDPDFRLVGRARGTAIDAVASADPRDSSVDRFLDAVRAGDRSLVACSPADALGTLRTILACEQAITTGERVAVGEI